MVENHTTNGENHTKNGENHTKNKIVDENIEIFLFFNNSHKNTQNHTKSHKKKNLCRKV